MRTARVLPRVSISLTALLSLAACGGGSGGGSTPPQPAPQTLSQPQVQAIGTAVAGQLAESSSSMTVNDVLSSSGASSRARSTELQSLAGCVTESPNPPVIDPNGIPNNVAYSFNCSTAGFFGGSASYTGAATIADTSSGGTTSLAYTAQNLRLAITGGFGGSFVETWNGTRTPGYSSTGVTLAHRITVVRTLNSDPPATIQNNSTVVFSAPGGGVAPNQPLPSGTIVANGTLAWTRANENFSIALSTPAALVYDATCSSVPRITGGTAVATVSASNANASVVGTVTVTFKGCGASPSISQT